MEDKIRIGVFGAHCGMTMMKVLAKHSHAALVAVCDQHVPTLNKVRELAEEYQLDVALYSDSEDFFGHDMDAVVLANYADEHVSFAIRLLKSGRHVMSEVLPCETMAQAVELIEAVEESGRVYAYAEKYCYMWHTLEMRKRYEAGEIGEVQYCEGECVHDAVGAAPQTACDGRDHRHNAAVRPNSCGTHSLGPLMTITGRRPRMVSQHSSDRKPGGAKHDTAGAAVEMVTFDNGAIARSLHDEREPSRTRYSIYGMKGDLESGWFKPACAPEDAKVEKHTFRNDKFSSSRFETYTPDPATRAALAKEFTGHGGSDFYPIHFFIEKIRGTEEGKKYSIDVYTAMDMCIVGILAHRSLLEGGIPMDVPNLRNREERDAWRNDNK